jgi:hypothetical protein
MNADQIKHWLMQTPRPAFVRVTDDQGGVNEVVCGQSTWVKCAETIASMRPDLLQALTAEKQVVRALRPADYAEDWAPEDEPAPARRAPPAPTIPLANLDPESARFALFAQLLAEAYRHSSDVAFGRLSDMVEAMNRRAENVERTREAMYRAHVKQLEEALRQAGAEPPEAPNGELLQNMLGGLLQGALMAKAGAPVPNGKA